MQADAIANFQHLFKGGATVPNLGCSPSLGDHHLHPKSQRQTFDAACQRTVTDKSKRAAMKIMYAMVQHRKVRSPLPCTVQKVLPIKQQVSSEHEHEHENMFGQCASRIAAHVGDRYPS